MQSILPLRLILISINVFFLCSISNAQDKEIYWQDIFFHSGGTFYDYQKSFNAYWDNRKIEKGKGYKQFKRWEAHMAPRVYPSGDISQTTSTYQNYMDWYKNNSHYFAKDDHRAGNWTSLGPEGKPSGSGTGAGRINFVRFNPDNANIIYIGAPDGGLWKTTNGNNATPTWRTNTDFLTIVGVSDLVIDPDNTNIMYLATGDLENDRNSIGILKSVDGGTNWESTDAEWPLSNYWKISKLLMNPSDPLNMLASTNVGIFRTTDGWQSYTPYITTVSFQDMEYKPGDFNTIYASGDELWKSTDNGINWTQITSGLPTSNIQRIALGVSPNNPSYVYALIGKADDQGFLGLYRSSNSGLSYTLMSSSPNLLGYEPDGSDVGGQAFYDLSLAVSSTDAQCITVGGVNVWQSSNGGSTWTLKSHWYGAGGVPDVHADVHEINYLPGSGSTLFSCNDGGIFKSTDNGNSWTDISGNLTIAQQTEIGLSSSNQNLIVAGHQDNGSNLYSNSGWTNIFGGDGGDCFIDRTNNNTLYFSYVNAEFHRSYDGGATETQITTGMTGDADFYSRWYQDPVSANTLWAAGRQYIWKSTNQGTTWTELDYGYGSGSIKAIAVAPSNTNIIYIINEDAVSRSSNGAGYFDENVTGTLPVTSAALTDIIVSNTDPDNIWVSFSGYSAGNKVFHSTDGGLNWVNISNGLPNLPFNTLVYVNNNANDAIYVGGDIGVYYWDNTLSNWIPYFNDLPNCNIKDLEIYYPTSRLRAATYGRGTWESDQYDPYAHCSITVSNTNNDGLGSLRRAIACAEDGATILFNATMTDGIGDDTIKLTSGPILISKMITLDQTSTTRALIKAVGPTGPVFNVAGSKTLSLKNIDIFSGTNSGERALLNNGFLVLDNVYIHENSTIGSGTTLTNLGNLTIFGDVRIIVDP